jgi:predicted aspartyl protease
MPPTLGQAKSFTLQLDGLSNVLITAVHVAEAFDPKQYLSGENSAGKMPPHSQFKAIWDTGATGSVITKTVIEQCGLKPIGMTEVHTANGVRNSEVFLINMVLPNKVGFHNIKVTEGSIGGDVQVLIGMDIICRGDFALTHKDQKTTFSFRWPSIECIDFVKQTNEANIRMASRGPGVIGPSIGSPSVGRNSPCPCGSGKKYKRCHGK